MELEIMAIKLPPEVKREFDKKAKSMDLTMSQIGRKLIENWLKSNPDPEKLKQLF